MEIERVRAELQRFVAAECGATYRIEDLRPAGGHAGLTFLFTLVHPEGAREDLVLRLPPEGVRRRGNTDVYRQAPLLRALHAAGQPVPRVRWAQSEEKWFGLPFIVMERLPGTTFLIWDPDPALDPAPEAMRGLWLRAADTLAGLHRFDWRTELADWEPVRPLADEIRFWRPIYERAPEPAWIDAAREVEELLLESVPAEPRVGLFHGDYQPGNVLYRDGRVTGVIDWELAGIGAQALDLGWLMMMADPAMWAAEYQPRHPPPVAEIRSRYERALGEPVAHAHWYEALAGYRFGAIACLNVKLHRKGQREDPLWENVALCVPSLFGHARELLTGA